MSARQQFSALVEVDRDEQVDELVRLAADAEIGLTVYDSCGACTCDSVAVARPASPTRKPWSASPFAAVSAATSSSSLTPTPRAATRQWPAMGVGPCSTP